MIALALREKFQRENMRMRRLGSLISKIHLVSFPLDSKSEGIFNLSIVLNPIIESLNIHHLLPLARSNFLPSDRTLGAVWDPF
jgi:hypothetical protein